MRLFSLKNIHLVKMNFIRKCSLHLWLSTTRLKLMKILCFLENLQLLTRNSSKSLKLRFLIYHFYCFFVQLHMSHGTSLLPLKHRFCLLHNWWIFMMGSFRHYALLNNDSLAFSYKNDVCIEVIDIRYTEKLEGSFW